MIKSEILTFAILEQILSKNRKREKNAQPINLLLWAFLMCLPSRTMESRNNAVRSMRLSNRKDWKAKELLKRKLLTEELT